MRVLLTLSLKKRANIWTYCKLQVLKALCFLLHWYRLVYSTNNFHFPVLHSSREYFSVSAPLSSNHNSWKMLKLRPYASSIPRFFLRREFQPEVDRLENQKTWWGHFTVDKIMVSTVFWEPTIAKEVLIQKVKTKLSHE